MIGFGVIGANSFVANAAVLPAIEASQEARLVIAGSRSGPTSYHDVLDHPEVEIVYLPLPNGMHEEWTAKAAAAGKHVLCEKPLAPTAAAGARMVQCCERAGVRLFEAWMTPFSPPWANTIAEASVAQVTHISSRFTFTIGTDNEANYRWDPTQGGGALLDVGIYALGPAVTLWGPNPDTVHAEIEQTPGGVDLTTRASLSWPGGRRCDIVTSFGLPEAQELTLSGPGFERSLSGNAHTGVEGTYTRMIDAVCRDLSGNELFPRPAADAVAMLELIERIAASA